MTNPSRFFLDPRLAQSAPPSTRPKTPPQPQQTQPEICDPEKERKYNQMTTIQEQSGINMTYPGKKNWDFLFKLPFFLNLANFILQLIRRIYNTPKLKTN